MRRARFLEQERELAAERRVKYRGTASIKLEALHSRDDDLRELDEKNVARLKRLFQEDGCRRLELRNHVPALIDQQQLDAAIQASGTSAEGLLADPSNGYPELYFPPGYQLGVDLYRTGMDSVFRMQRSFGLRIHVRPQPGTKEYPGQGVLQREETRRR